MLVVPSLWNKLLVCGRKLTAYATNSGHDSMFNPLLFLLASEIHCRMQLLRATAQTTAESFERSDAGARFYMVAAEPFYGNRDRYPYLLG